MKALLKISTALALIAIFGLSYQYIYATDAEDNIVTISEREGTSEEEDVLDEAIAEDDGGDISSVTYGLVRKKLTTPYTEKTNKKEAKTKMFSRCPSGNRAWIEDMAATEAEYSYGQMSYYEGCDDGKLICHFRARLSDKSVDVLQSDSVTYVAADLWISKTTVKK